MTKKKPPILLITLPVVLETIAALVIALLGGGIGFCVAVLIWTYWQGSWAAFVSLGVGSLLTAFFMLIIVWKKVKQVDALVKMMAEANLQIEKRNKIIAGHNEWIGRRYRQTCEMLLEQVEDFYEGTQITTWVLTPTPEGLILQVGDDDRLVRVDLESLSETQDLFLLLERAHLEWMEETA